MLNPLYGFGSKDLVGSGRISTNINTNGIFPRIELGYKIRSYNYKPELIDRNERWIKLLKVGFDTLDIGSFVSKKKIPQLADTSEIIKNIKIDNSITKLLVIVGNERGAKEAVSFDEITYLGFPFSISETFQKRNINSSIKDSLIRLEKIQNICTKKKTVTYFSMDLEILMMTSGVHI